MSSVCCTVTKSVSQRKRVGPHQANAEEMRHCPRVSPLLSKSAPWRMHQSSARFLCGSYLSPDMSVGSIVPSGATLTTRHDTSDWNKSKRDAETRGRLCNFEGRNACRGELTACAHCVLSVSEAPCTHRMVHRDAQPQSHDAHPASLR